MGFGFWVWAADLRLQNQTSKPKTQNPRTQDPTHPEGGEGGAKASRKQKCDTLCKLPSVPPSPPRMSRVLGSWVLGFGFEGLGLGSWALGLGLLDLLDFNIDIPVV